MRLAWLGGSSFYATAAGRTVCMNPAADTCPGDGLATFSGATTAPTADGVFIIDGPGEYEVDGVFVVAVAAAGATGQPCIVYSIRLGDVAVCHIGEAGASLSEQDLEDIGAIDVLLVPVGPSEGGDGRTTAADIVHAVEPALVVPWFGATEAGARALEHFLKEMAIDTPDGVAALEVDPLRLPDETQVRVLTPTSAADLG